MPSEKKGRQRVDRAGRQIYISNIDCPVDKLMDEAAKLFFNYALGSHVVAEGGGKCPVY
jgi:hypothetical protein